MKISSRSGRSKPRTTWSKSRTTGTSETSSRNLSISSKPAISKTTGSEGKGLNLRWTDGSYWRIRTWLGTKTRLPLLTNSSWSRTRRSSTTSWTHWTCRRRNIWPANRSIRLIASQERNVSGCWCVRPQRAELRSAPEGLEGRRAESSEAHRGTTRESLRRAHR